MAHTNIQYPESEHDYKNVLRRQIAEQKLETAFHKSRAEQFENELQAIFENIKNGDECFLVYEDNEIIYSEAKPSPKRSKDDV